MRDVAYVDASAFVKLVVEEAESSAFADAADPWQWFSSRLLSIEVLLAVHRRAPDRVDAARRLLHGVTLLDIDRDICDAARELGGLRALDAIHLATALSLGDRCGTFFAYDDRLAAAAQAHGLTVSVPRP